MNQRGFTFVEVTVVLSILIMLASTAMLRVNPGQYDLDNSSRELLSDIRWLRQLSINCADKSLRADYTISIANDGYTLTAGTNTKNVTFPSGVSGRNSIINFNIDGSPCDPSGEKLTTDQTMTLKNSSKSKQIVITPTSGRVIIR